MNDVIQWPAGDFTLQEATDLNPAVPQASLRKKLADALAAKTITQTKKGDAQVKGTFQVAKPEAAPGV